MRRKTFFVTMLAIAVFAMNVFATTAEAGALGLKPSANQGVAQPSGNIANTANAAQNVGYDTVKYQYPAQQLKAEGKNFDRYNWRLFLRFDTGELMVQDWVASMNWQIREYADNTYMQTRGVETYAFDFRKEFLSDFDREWTWEGFRVSISDNRLLFVKPSSVTGDRAVYMSVDVHVKPQNCYPRGTYIWVTGAQHHNGSKVPCAAYQELYWYNISCWQTTNETLDEYNAKYGHAVMPVKLYYPSVKRALYVSGWCLDDVAKYMPIIDGAYPDANPENGSHYTYLLHYKLRSLPGMKKIC